MPGSHSNIFSITKDTYQIIGSAAGAEQTSDRCAAVYARTSRIGRITLSPGVDVYGNDPICENAVLLCAKPHFFLFLWVRVP